MDLKEVTIWYVHRGALHNIKSISGTEIISIGRSFLDTEHTSIPYHRITKITYGTELVFDRQKIKSKDKQL
jgi:uncharacterized protein (UPF0248 family)